MKPPLRVVLDTSVVLSALVLRGGPAARLREAWQSLRMHPLAGAATARELVRVLTCPKFQLSETEQHDLLGDYLPWVEVVTVKRAPADVPRCRDPHDVPFLELAIAGRANALVTGDQDLLEIGRASRACPIVSIASFIDAHLK